MGAAGARPSSESGPTSSCPEYSASCRSSELLASVLYLDLLCASVCKICPTKSPREGYFWGLEMFKDFPYKLMVNCFFAFCHFGLRKISQEYAFGIAGANCNGIPLSWHTQNAKILVCYNITYNNIYYNINNELIFKLNSEPFIFLDILQRICIIKNFKKTNV